MSEQKRSRKSKSNAPKPKHQPAPPTIQTESIGPEALRRTKDNSYPLIKSGDMLALQGVVGNKALRQMVQPGQMGSSSVIRRHAIPDNRQGVGAEEDEIQRRRDDQHVQRHAIPDNRQGVGAEEDEIQTRRDKASIQRTPAFGLAVQTRRQRSQQPNLWGKPGSPRIQRKDGDKADVKSAPKAADPKAGGAEAGVKEAPAEDPAVKQAKAEFGKFVGGGPYQVPNFVPDTVDNFGKFDVDYYPSKKLLEANMRVKFQFPDMTTGDWLQDIINLPKFLMIQQQYIQGFIKTVTTGWSGKFNFKNVREPQSVWGQLNPIRVKVNVTPVQANQHYTFNKYFKDQLDAKGVGKVPNVESNNTGQVHMYKFDTTKRGFTGAASVGQEEVTRLQRNLPKIRFANTSAAVDAKYDGDIQFVGDYLRRMNRPKFNIDVIGHANKSGNEPDNLKYSQARADNVMARLKAAGVTNHKLTAAGVGSTGATANGSWRKVDFKIAVDKGFSNVQDVDMHEFGHMLGLDDDYYRGASDTRGNTTQHQMKMMQKMLGSDSYGKGKEDRYADEVTKIYKNEASADVMHAGNEVRVYNYVTFWQAMFNAGAAGGNQPAPAFTWKDWKVIG
ncbi:MAG: OmpA family protein [Anaerolineales bacterium]|nr:OmpA family protein [Anaerolineales bacterium]MCB0012067.1 OmpA family protein [Anaerolineales bacterium]MCB0018138.1 OmpA family protein [Anaerolineales bacterium]